MKKTKILSILALICALNSADLNASPVTGDHKTVRELREAVRLYDIGMIGRAKSMLEGVSKKAATTDARGYAVLSDVITAAPGYEVRMNEFFVECPYSIWVPEIKYRHALNVFNSGDYKTASALLEELDVKQVNKADRTEFLFKRAYCDFENQDYERALVRFQEVQLLPVSDYTVPSCYALGYINYQQRNFDEALMWFEKTVRDSRFSSVSNWYLMECRFMLKDYMYITNNAPGVYESIPDERKPFLARIISESYLILDDADNAKKWLEKNAGENVIKNRSDWFHRGSVQYAIEDYASAIESYSMMLERTDSLGQIANYHLGYSYIKTRNKIAAMAAFKDASLWDYDKDIAEDAYFNYAKLAFDLNDDSSVFEAYMEKYPSLKKDDKINSYIAVSALHKKDYAAAIEAYDKIDELNQNMQDNFMKANYLRAVQLMENGSYRAAVPCLETAAYYAGKGTRFNHLARYWIAESYYRDAQYDKARAIYVDLYNKSAMFNTPEGRLITYNLAYCYFMDRDYTNAIKWFDRYMEEAVVEYRKDALERKGDCYFITKKYKTAALVYDLVLNDYFSADDIYPYYQAALSYGLSNNNTKKTKLLENVLNASENAPFYSEALYELGRSYVAANKNDKAFECFEKLSKSKKDGNYVAKAYLELGSISRNRNQLDDAMGYYKFVVEQLPASGYEEDALLAIENLYRLKNESEEYVAYIERIGKGATKTEAEKEELVFSSAEQVFLSENYQKALTSLKSYLKKYPSGKNLSKANFYLAESYKALDMKEQACDCYEIAIAEGEGAFVEVAMLNYSALSYKLEKWDDALGGYEALFASAKMDENRFLAKVGIMRAAYKARKMDKTVQYAQTVVEDHRSSDALKQEANYILAKSYMSQSRRDEAMTVLKKLAEDPSTSYGAEATYMLITDSYDSGDFQAVENKVFAFSDAATGQTYWLAKSFIILGDSFVDRGEYAQAKATFESVRDGYTATDDDVLSEVNMRLEKLQNVIASNN